MNRWMKLSIEYANQRSYLDDLFRIYPTIPEGIRDFDETKWLGIETAFNNRDNLSLLEQLLLMDLFPVKDSYVAYLKRDKTSILRNPNTVNRLCGRLYDMGLTKIHERATEPKETNRQIGPMFKAWLRSNAIGIDAVDISKFTANSENAILDANDSIMADFARVELSYTIDKGLDFIARLNNKYVIGEAKFLTDFGGHQNAQFNDALNLINSKAKAIKVAILDGVLYIKGSNKMFRTMTVDYGTKNIMSALLLRDFLYSI
ncbi:MAG: hypothetical protein Q8J62_09105 [Candidatus Cloacimonadaceae bacterium]|nr:hypothetical protein [Candidatus Cloacimonadaceae bacterium]